MFDPDFMEDEEEPRNPWVVIALIVGWIVAMALFVWGVF